MTALVLLVLVIASAFSSVRAQSPAPDQVKTVSIPVEGMSCVSCAARVKRTLKGIEGVQRVEVSLERREATVRFAADRVTPDRLEAAINELGYKAGKSRVVESK
jgi:copper ion binding protein